MNFEDLNHAIVNQTIEAISVVDLDGNYLFVNTAFCELMGYTFEELLTKTVFDMRAPTSSHLNFENAKLEEKGFKSKVLLQKKDGTVFLSEVIATKLNITGVPVMLGVVKDITLITQTEKDLQKTQEIISMAMQVANDGVWDWHIDTNLVEFDERYYTMAGYEKDEFEYSFDEWSKRVHPDDIEASVEQFELYLDEQIESYDVEFRFLRKDNSYMWIRARGKIVARDEKGNALRFIGTHSDITLQKEHESKTIYQANYDSLTKLPNRLLSLDRLEQQCIKAKREHNHVALLFIDLDNFKIYNDTMGHEAGDLILIESAKRFLSVIRDSDTVGRLGGDEFLVILGNIEDKTNLQNTVKKILSCFNDPFTIMNKELTLGTSIGIAIYPNDGTTTSELLKNADTAMYDAKAKGKNTYKYYTNQMNESAKRRFILEEQMRNALKQGEFHVYYQPKIDTKDLNIIGAEALLRWDNSVLGLVHPTEFIPVAEQTGLILDIGKFVLKEAMKKASEWKKSFIEDFKIAVNLSPVQFRDADLLEYIQEYIHLYNFDTSSLELEITEGVLMSGFNQVENILSEINKLGIHLAMDDFGTGYSSLSYLRKYPFNIVKIDKSFIDGIANNSEDRALVAASIAMSKVLNLVVVAEGIENYEQFEVLQSLECDFIQGFLFDKALSAEEFTKRMAINESYARVTT